MWRVRCVGGDGWEASPEFPSKSCLLMGKLGATSINRLKMAPAFSLAFLASTCRQVSPLCLDTIQCKTIPSHTTHHTTPYNSTYMYHKHCITHTITSHTTPYHHHITPSHHTYHTTITSHTPSHHTHHQITHTITSHTPPNHTHHHITHTTPPSHHTHITPHQTYQCGVIFV